MSDLPVRICYPREGDLIAFVLIRPKDHFLILKITRNMGGSRRIKYLDLTDRKIRYWKSVWGGFKHLLVSELDK